jgi:hypothetical protein
MQMQIIPIRNADELIAKAINHFLVGLFSLGLAIISSSSVNEDFPSTKGISFVYVESRLNCYSHYYLWFSSLFFSLTLFSSDLFSSNLLPSAVFLSLAI